MQYDIFRYTGDPVKDENQAIDALAVAIAKVTGFSRSAVVKKAPYSFGNSPEFIAVEKEAQRYGIYWDGEEVFSLFY